MPKKQSPYGNGLWFGILAILFGSLCGLSVTLPAQTSLQTFTSQDRVFKFQYSPVLVHCTSQQSEEGYPGSWIPDACSSQEGVCDDALSSATTIACFAYPKDNFKDKPTFSAAAFFVAEVRAPEQPITRKACLEGSPGWWPPETARKTTRGQSTRINTINAKLFRVTDSWTSGFQTGEIYRVFHGNKCYGLGIQDTGAKSTAFEPEQYEEIEKAATEDDKNYGQLLSQVLHSFRFLAVGRP